MRKKFKNYMMKELRKIKELEYFKDKVREWMGKR